MLAFEESDLHQHALPIISIKLPSAKLGTELAVSVDAAFTKQLSMLQPAS